MEQRVRRDFSYNSGLMKSVIERLYHSITEISKILGEEQHVLRYWEREFPQLKPQKNRAGNRIYTAKDLAVLRTIQRLLREERLTVASAKEYLRQHGVEEQDEGFAIAETTDKNTDQGRGQGSTGMDENHGQELERVQAVAKRTAKELREIAQTLRQKAKAEARG